MNRFIHTDDTPWAMKLVNSLRCALTRSAPGSRAGGAGRSHSKREVPEELRCPAFNAKRNPGNTKSNQKILEEALLDLARYVR